MIKWIRTNIISLSLPLLLILTSHFSIMQDIENLRVRSRRSKETKQHNEMTVDVNIINLNHIKMDHKLTLIEDSICMNRASRINTSSICGDKNEHMDEK